MANEQLGRVGRTLQGLSAGLQGRGPEFTQGLRQGNREDSKLKQQQDSERAKTAFIDANAALNLFDQGRFDLISQLYGRRLEASQNHPGVNFDSSNQIFTLAGLAAQGDEEARTNLGETLNNGVIVGRSLGVIETPDQPSALDVAKTEKLQAETANIESGEGSTGLASAKTMIFPNGASMEVLPSGSTQVTNPAGDIVAGQDRIDVLKEAQQAEIDRAVALGGGTAAGKAAIKISTQAFDRLDGIRANKLNINEAIRLIDEGAETGPIAAKFPSIRAASVKLDNLQGRLGLDVLRTTTFGALSAAELKFALDTALPQGLEGPELKSWLVEKRDSQDKLADYLESVAIFLGRPGNTPAKWLERQRELSREPTAQAGGDDLSAMSDEQLQQLRAQAGGQ